MRPALPYLADLGVSHLYASPCQKVRCGSTHGYAIVDYGQLDPELGDADDYRAMVEALHRHGMGQILDTVSNHMSAAPAENLWWTDVLENGPASPHAAFFDIDWHPIKEELQNRVLLPILGGQYGQVLEAGELKLEYRDGAFFLRVYQSLLPIEPRSYREILTHGLDALKETLPPDSEELLELESIITAIEHLPECTATEPAGVAERQREKEVVKRRLHALVDRAPAVAEHIRPQPAGIQRHARRPAQLRQPRQAARRPGLPAFALEGGRRRDQLPPFLRHQRTGGRLHGIARGLRRKPRSGIRVARPRRRGWPAGRSHRRPVRAGGIPATIAEGIPAGAWQGRARQATDDACGAAVPAPMPPNGAPASTSAPFRRKPAALGGNRAGVSAASHRDDLRRPRPLPLYVVVEKILGGEENLPRQWLTAGTTGYDFISSVNGLFVDPTGLRELITLYDRFVDQYLDFREVAHQSKLLIFHTAMSSDLQLLAPSAQSHFGAASRLARFHAQRPADGAPRNPRLFSDLSHLHPPRRGFRTGPADCLPGGGPGEAPQRRHRRRGVRLHPRRAALASPARSGRGRPPRARPVRGTFPAGHQPGDGQGDRGHRLLPLLPACCR